MNNKDNNSLKKNESEIDENLNKKEKDEEMLKEEDLTETDNSQEIDNRTFGEKVEDTLDDVFGGIQDFLYGPGDNYSEDIPATIEKDSGIRKINKVQTRRNIAKKLFGKKGAKIFLIIIGIVFCDWTHRQFNLIFVLLQFCLYFMGESPYFFLKAKEK